jgi:hypothetical protein
MFLGARTAGLGNERPSCRGRNQAPPARHPTRHPHRRAGPAPREKIARISQAPKAGLGPQSERREHDDSDFPPYQAVPGNVGNEPPHPRTHTSCAGPHGSRSAACHWRSRGAGERSPPTRPLASAQARIPKRPGGGPAGARSLQPDPPHAHTPEPRRPAAARSIQPRSVPPVLIAVEAERTCARVPHAQAPAAPTRDQTRDWPRRDRTGSEQDSPHEHHRNDQTAGTKRGPPTDRDIRASRCVALQHPATGPPRTRHR